MEEEKRKVGKKRAQIKGGKTMKKRRKRFRGRITQSGRKQTERDTKHQ